MKLWILGKNGLVGKAMEAACKKKSLRYVATTHLEVDITKLEALRCFAEKERITHIVNCAAYTLVDEAEVHPELAYRANADGPENLGNLARHLGIRVVHLSTDYVFDGQKMTSYSETDPCRPLSVYGHSKWLGEQRLLAQLPTACIVRTAWVFGKGGKNFFSTLLPLLQEKRELQVISDQKSSPTYSFDLAQAILALLCHSGIFHFANRGACSRFEMAEFVKQEAEKRGIPLACQQLLPLKVSEVHLAAPRPFYSSLCTKKIETVLGQAPRTWQEAMREFLHETSCVIRFL